MIIWKYDNPPLEEGTEIIAEFTTFRSVVRIEKLTRVYPCQEFYAWVPHGTTESYRDGQINIAAWDYYSEPCLPEEPQNCPDPRCGCEMVHMYNNDELGYERHFFRCPGCQWDSFTRTTEEEAVKILNSIKVVD